MITNEMIRRLKDELGIDPFWALTLIGEHEEANNYKEKK